MDTTLIADRNPTIDMPLRIQTLTGNSPGRVSRMMTDDVLRQSTFSPFAYSQMKQYIAQTFTRERPGMSGVEILKDILADRKIVPAVTSEDATSITAIKDFTMLAFSSKRAGKKEVEAGAYLALGIIYDNQSKRKQVSANYQPSSQLMFGT